MIFPNPDSSLNEEAGKQQQEDFDGYCKVGLFASSADILVRTINDFDSRQLQQASC